MGKTTVVVRAISLLHHVGVDVTGFYTEEVRDGDRRAGFDLVLVHPGTAGHEDRRPRVPLARVDLDSEVRVGRYGVDTEAVGAHALPTLERHADVVVVDEIAPMELATPGFDDAVERVLEGRNAVLATLHQGEHAYARHLRQRDDTTVTEVTPENRDELPSQLAARLATGAAQ